MRKVIERFFKFLVPIVRNAVVQVAADELTRLAYPGRRRPYYRGYNQTARTSYNNFTKDIKTADILSQRNIGEFHDVILVAFDLDGPSSESAQKWLMDNMPQPGHGGDDDEIFLDSWWIANDERYDRSDTESAVFVKKGKQAEARVLLRLHGLA